MENFRQSLATKITLFSTIVVLITAVTIATIVYTVANRFFYQATVRNLENESKLISSDIENSLIKIIDDVRILSKTPPIQGIVRANENNGIDEQEKSNLDMWKNRLATIFKSMLQVNKHYTQIRYLSIANDGKEIVRVNRSEDEIFRTDENSLQSKKDEDYFKEAKNITQGNIIFSKINFNRENGKIQYPLVPTLRAIMPIYDKKQKLFGLLIININLERYLKETLFRDSSKYNVVVGTNDNDIFIYDKEKKLLKFHHRDFPIENGFMGKKNINKANKIIPFLKNHPKLITISQPIFSSFHHDTKVLTLLLIAPKEALIKQDREHIYTILIWIFLVCIVASLLIFTFTRKKTKHLTNMAKQIAASNSIDQNDLHLPTQLTDEVGLLARAFERKTKLLSQLALYDTLTGLPNRKNFFDHLEESMNRANRKKQSIGIIFIDLNNFKDVNDNYGHEYGDQLLIKFSKKLKEIIRATDYCARLSGDEFVVIVEEVGNTEDLSMLTSRYERSLNTNYVAGGMSFDITISGGISLYPDDADTPVALLKFADQAMYASKREGLGKIQRFTPRESQK